MPADGSSTPRWFVATGALIALGLGLLVALGPWPLAVPLFAAAAVLGWVALVGSAGAEAPARGSGQSAPVTGDITGIPGRSGARRPTPGRLIVAGLAGLAVGPLAAALDIPGNGSFAVVGVTAGVVAGLVAPGWAGYAAVLAGLLAGLLAMLLAGSGAGLWWLIMAVLSALVSYGALVAATVHRAWMLGWQPALRDGRAQFGVVALVGLALLFALIAADLARNPA